MTQRRPRSKVIIVGREDVEVPVAAEIDAPVFKKLLTYMRLKGITSINEAIEMLVNEAISTDVEPCIVSVIVGDQVIVECKNGALIAHRSALPDAVEGKALVLPSWARHLLSEFKKV